MPDYHVYILANPARRLYIGVTRDLRTRVWQHKTRMLEGYTADHGIDRLVYHEATNDVRVAIAHEKQLKRWPRARKVRLIERHNAGWLDLAVDWFPEARSSSRQDRLRVPRPGPDRRSAPAG